MTIHEWTSMTNRERPKCSYQPSRGGGGGGNLSRELKSCRQKLRPGLPTRDDRGHVCRINRVSTQIPNLACELVIFTESNVMGITIPHHDALVITTEIAHCEVAWVFFDGRLISLFSMSSGNSESVKVCSTVGGPLWSLLAEDTSSPSDTCP
ncbi:hypothetical protein Pyn_20114 [Prunus yedoensis var. nudiflora]|uniref:Uncharacterized protein n=1 Tax=Prunus yedoensis var. nudiflora TaxID=2094558 RepID=A0A314UJ75_PRUYE|nr:hypothetical protein Pyn_20114 [Prunus yedoensis var. nudiflora]